MHLTHLSRGRETNVEPSVGFSRIQDTKAVARFLDGLSDVDNFTVWFDGLNGMDDITRIREQKWGEVLALIVVLRKARVEDRDRQAPL